ncbi:hypothetical protein Nmel_018124 [Mimus melanotis]
MLRHSCSYGLGPEVSAAPRPRSPPAPCAAAVPHVPLPAGRGRAGAGALGALQRGQPALLPLRAPGVGGGCRHCPRRLPEVVDAEHGAVGLCPAPGHPAVRRDGHGVQQSYGRCSSSLKQLVQEEKKPSCLVLLEK